VVRPWELWVASPEDVACGRYRLSNDLPPFPPIYGPLSEGWLEIADMIAHADLWPHVAPVSTDEDYVALIAGAEI
jgi:hypothetical protein